MLPVPPGLLTRERREWEWLSDEVAYAARLTDGDRSQILRDLFRTAESFRRAKTDEENRRDDEVRSILDREGLARYAALAERLACP